MDLIKDSMPPTKDMLFVMMHENLISMIDEKYTPVPKFFTGDEEERVEWVKNVIKEMIDLSWHHFGKDKDGQLGDDETFKLIQDLQPKSKLDQAGFHKVFKLYDNNNDGEFDKGELAILLQKIHGPIAVFSQEKIVTNMIENLKQLIIDNNVAKVFKGSEADRLVWVE